MVLYIILGVGGCLLLLCIAIIVAVVLRRRRDDAALADEPVMSVSTVDHIYQSARAGPEPSTYSGAEFVGGVQSGPYAAIPRASEVFESANSADYKSLPLITPTLPPMLYDVGNVVN